MNTPERAHRPHRMKLLPIVRESIQPIGERNESVPSLPKQETISEEITERHPTHRSDSESSLSMDISKTDPKIEEDFQIFNSELLVEDEEYFECGSCGARFRHPIIKSRTGSLSFWWGAALCLICFCVPCVGGCVCCLGRRKINVCVACKISLDGRKFYL